MAKLVHNVQKKQHKERSQILSRAKYGLLEKKKDYKLRADDYHKKEAALKALRLKAEQYNPDEYYHAMTRRKTDEDGIIITDRGNESLSVAQVKLLKSQDVNYVRTMRLNEKEKAGKLRNQLNFKSNGKHTVFVDLDEHQDAFSAAKYFDTDESFLDRRENRLRLKQLETSDRLITQEIDHDSKDELKKKKVRQYKLLKEHMMREKQLRQVEERLELTREVMKKGDKKKMVDSNGNVVFNWKAMRKK